MYISGFQVHMSRSNTTSSGSAAAASAGGCSASPRAYGATADGRSRTMPAAAPPPRGDWLARDVAAGFIEALYRDSFEVVDNGYMQLIAAEGYIHALRKDCFTR